MRVVVTGGSGLVGRRIVTLLAREHDVVNFDLREPPEHAAPYVRGDILETAALLRALDGADVVVHAAALPGPSFGTEAEIQRVNVTGTETVAEAAIASRVPRIVHISSDAVLGFVFSGGRTKPLYLPVDEAHPLSPVEPYGRSKLAAELALRRLVGPGLTVVSLRPPWVWVPEEYEKYSRLTAHPDEWSDGLWAYVHGDDLARAVEMAVTRPAPEGFHAVFVDAPDNGTTLPTRVLVDRHHPGTPLDPDHGEFAGLISSNAAEQLLGWSATMVWREFLA
jgi:nucleoside-diphosphate-sugar epimerase